MLALRWYAANDIRLEDIPEPVCPDDSVKMKVKFCGICGTDIHEYKRGPLFVPSQDKPNALGITAPVVLGHEFSGEIVEVGKNVTRFKPGDRVIGEPRHICRTCKMCRTGHDNICEKVVYTGLGTETGGFAEYLVCQEEMVHIIPEGVSYAEASAYEPFANTYHAITNNGFKKGMTALVTGMGPIGMAMVANLKVLGASKIFAVVRFEDRVERAKAAGVDVILCDTPEKMLEQVREQTDGSGVDMALEASGAEEMVKFCIDATANCGTIVQMGCLDGPMVFDTSTIVNTEKKLVGTMSFLGSDTETALKFMEEKKYPLDEFISKKIWLGDIIEDGFKLLVNDKTESQMKVVVTPEKELLEE